MGLKEKIKEEKEKFDLNIYPRVSIFEKIIYF